VRSNAAVIRAFSAEIEALQGQVEALFAQHPDAKIYRGQPGLGVILAARVRRLADPLHQQAFCALTASPGARAY
jgi:hypothetical protein